LQDVEVNKEKFKFPNMKPLDLFLMMYTSDKLFDLTANGDAGYSYEDIVAEVNRGSVDYIPCTRRKSIECGDNVYLRHLTKNEIILFTDTIKVLEVDIEFEG